MDVLAEALEQQLAGGAELDRLAERLRQLLDAGPLALLVGEVVEVLLHRRRQLVALLDPLEARVQHRREGQVGVAGRVGAAQLGPRGALLARVVDRHAHQGRAVAPAPRGVDRRLVAQHQALVRVDPLREHAADLARVAQEAGDKALGLGRQVDSSSGSKNAFWSPRKRLWWMCMPLPFSPKSGLGMKVA